MAVLKFLLLATASATLELTGDTFDEAVLSSGKSAFVKFLAPCELKIACSPTSKASCSKEELAQLEKDLAIPRRRTAELVKIYEAMDADAEKHDAYLEELQARFLFAAAVNRASTSTATVRPVAGASATVWFPQPQ
ncbi:hypothetical protein JL720_9128 [Aureococcus anophagefferens]|nr:hypothetical protein JL720_9128 [Aureococcus anophagefferens]